MPSAAVQTTVVPPLPAPKTVPKLSDALFIMAWFGLLTGFIEAAVKALQRFGFDQIIHASRDVYWMAPLAGLLLVLTLGLGAYALTRLLPRLKGWWLVIFVPAFIGLLNLLFLIPPLHHYSALLLAAGGAAQIARLMSTRMEIFRPLAQRMVWGMMVALAAIAIATQGWGMLAERRAVARLGPPAPNAPNVLLIVLDTVRAHNLSVYGYSRATSPNLEKLANGGVVFERALSTSSWTLPSHASMFTGRFAHEMSATWTVPLDDIDPTLAERLSARGYLTGGFVANTSYCNYEQGLDRGFTTYKDYRVSFGQLEKSLSVARTIRRNLRVRQLIRNDELPARQSAEEINERFLRWLPRNNERPFFAFLNFYDAHEPYLPPASFAKKFGPGRRYKNYSPLHHDPRDSTNDYRLSPANHQEEIDAYDGAIAYLDHHLGELFDELRRRGHYDNTLIIVTADHGEEFGENGLYSHGNSLYLPSVHVPLLVSLPGRAPAGQRIAEAVTLRDLPATVVEMIGLPDRFPGQSLTRYWANATPPVGTEPSPLLSSVRQVHNSPTWFPVNKGDLSSLVSDGYRYLRNGDGSEELYDFASDPWEQNNLAGRVENQKVLELLRMRLDTLGRVKTAQSGSHRSLKQTTN